MTRARVVISCKCCIFKRNIHFSCHPVPSRGTQTHGTRRMSNIAPFCQSCVVTSGIRDLYISSQFWFRVFSSLRMDENVKLCQAVTDYRLQYWAL